jgi:hypothetical protein
LSPDLPILSPALVKKTLKKLALGIRHETLLSESAFAGVILPEDLKATALSSYKCLVTLYDVRLRYSQNLQRFNLLFIKDRSSWGFKPPRTMCHLIYTQRVS